MPPGYQLERIEKVQPPENIEEDQERWRVQVSTKEVVVQEKVYTLTLSADEVSGIYELLNQQYRDPELEPLYLELDRLMFPDAQY